MNPDTRLADAPANQAVKAQPHRTPVLLRANLVSIPVGLAGLAGCWSVGQPVVGAPAWVPAALWILAAAVFVAVVGTYTAQAARQQRFRRDFEDTTFSPFLVLPSVMVMRLGRAALPVHHAAGAVLVLTGLIATVAVGVALSARWVSGAVPLERWHAGYLLPTVAGGLVGAAAAAEAGWNRLSGLMFGYGAICWLILSAAVLVRLVTAPALPLVLRPTVAIEVAPPAVAGGAWFAMNGGHADTVAWALAGYGLLMVGVQVALARWYAAVPFGPSTWAFSFTYAQVLLVALRWLKIEAVPARGAWTALILAVATAGIGLLAARTVARLGKGTFLPRAPTSNDPPPATTTPATMAHPPHARVEPAEAAPPPRPSGR